MKRIAVFCDGTWNTPIVADHETNVSKLARMVTPRASDGSAQVGQYHAGVGTSGGPLARQFDGATGFGLSRNIRAAYRALAEEFQPGDEVFLFGFSRGAFTARSLGGFIRNCGILHRDQLGRLDEAFALYRRRDDASHPRAPLAERFRRDHAVETRIKFIGVFDTVGALGNPLLIDGGLLEGQRNRFHDLQLSSWVDNAYHALAVDEHRVKFQAALWEEPAEPVPGQVVRQVWFAGAHSNVGGGYPASTAGRGLASDDALRWMADAAQRCGLDLGLPGRPVDPVTTGAPINESRVSFYRLWKPFFRPVGTTGTQAVHESVVARYRATTPPLYRPINLVDRVSLEVP